MRILCIISLTIASLLPATLRAASHQAKPGDDLQAKINAMKPGDELVLADGTYERACIDLRLQSRITIRAEKIVPVTMAMKEGQPVGSGGNVIFKSADKPYALAGGREITVRGITVDSCANSVQSGAIKCGSGWKLEDVIVQNVDTVGITIDGHSEDVSWMRVVTQNNGYMGWGGGESKRIRIIDSGTFRNNLGWPRNVFGDHGTEKRGKWFVDPQWEAGGGKFAVCEDLVMLRVWAQGNNGPGIWFDWQNRNCVVRDSMSVRNVGLIHGYDSVGIETEINPGPILIENCLIEGNGIGILPAEEHKLTVRACHFVDNGIGFRNLGNAKDGWRNEGCQDVTITENFFYGDSGISFWGENDNMTPEYRRKNRIVTEPNSMNVAPPVKWEAGDLKRPVVERILVPEPTDGGVYVTDLHGAQNGYGPPELNRSNGEWPANDGRPLTIAGKTYAKGVGCHAPFRLTIPLDKKYSAIRFTAGIDDETRGSGSIAVQIYAGDKIIHDTGILRAGQDAKDVDVNIEGLDSIALVISIADEGHQSDHADLAWLRLIPSKKN